MTTDTHEEVNAKVEAGRIRYNLAKNVRATAEQFSGKVFEGLVESIRENGILQPLLVRPIATVNETQEHDYELVCGHRRLHAAIELKLEEVPVLIRDMTAEQCLAARVVENLQREDVHPLDEAYAIGDLHDMGMETAAIANKIGKSPSYVAKHASLRDLESSLAKWFREDRIWLGDAISLSRLPEGVQKSIAKTVRKMEGQGKTSIHVDHLIRAQLLSLADAPFDTKDKELLPEAGSCRDCQKRTGNQRVLFDDIKERNVCTDAICFQAKIAAHWVGHAKKMKAAGATVLTKAQAKEMFPEYGAVSDRKLMEYYGHDFDGSYKLEPVKLIPDPSPKDLVLGLDRKGAIRTLIPKKLVVKAFRATKPKPKKGEKVEDVGLSDQTKEKRARLLANEQNRDIHRLTLGMLAESGEMGNEGVALGETVKRALWFLTVLHAKAHRNILHLLPEDERGLDKFTQNTENGREFGYLDEEKVIWHLLPEPWTLGDLLALHLKIAQAVAVKDPGYRLEPDPNVIWAAAFAGVDVASCKEEVAKRLAPKPRGKKKDETTPE